MEEIKHNQYEEEDIITLDFDDGPSIRCGIMGIFDCEGKDYIALEALDDTEDVYLYGYRETAEDFDLLDIEDEATFEKVSAEFESLMDTPL